MVDSSDNEKQLSLKARSISECMLTTSTCTIVSVVIGTFLGIRKKSLRSFAYCITFGTFGDLFYGYTNKCRTLIDDYHIAKNAFELEKLKEKKSEK